MTPILIPARYGSDRFPGKPLAQIAGVPMIVRVARACAQVGRTYVVTDSPKIAEVANLDGHDSIVTGEARTGTDRCAEAMDVLDDYDRCLIVQGDEPLIRADDIGAMLDQTERLREGALVGSCPLASPAEAWDPGVVKLAASPSGRLLYASRSRIPGQKEGNRPAAGRKQVGIYGYTRPSLARFRDAPRRDLELAEDVEILRMLELDQPVRCVTIKGTNCSVDWPVDVCRVEDLL